MEGIFWGVLFLGGYSYFIYPLVLLALPGRRRGDASEQTACEALPELSLIITAHNEAERIGKKLENSLGLDYPAERLEIIVASDCSVDGTDEIVRGYADRGVRLVRADEHKGKEYAQWCAIRQARGEILVFSDVATEIPQDALRHLAAAFADPKVGAVSSEDRFVSADGRLVGEGAYVRYEMWLRRLESEHAGLVGLSGSFFAARREVCADWDIYSPSDFNTALNCARMGLVAVSCPRVLGYYSDIQDSAKEYQRKVRTVIRGLTAIARHPDVLDPLRMGGFAFQVWSHKPMRWGVPWFLLALLGVNLALAGEGGFYRLALVGQAGFYGLALAGWGLPALRENGVVRIVYFFVQTNVAIAQATLEFLRGRRMTVWTPSRR